MTEATWELQRGIYQALIASLSLKTAMGGTVRAYDRPPATLPVYPYLTIAECQALDDGDACEGDRFEIFNDIHVWSNTVGMQEAKTISGVVRNELLNLSTLNGWNIKIAQVQQARHMRDPDGITNHSVVTVKFTLEPA